jgi:hypothetical protein
MRSLHTREFRFEEFFDHAIPEYAILSHTWGLDEITYRDFLDIRKEDTDKFQNHMRKRSSIYHQTKRIYRVNAKNSTSMSVRKKAASCAKQKKYGAGYQKIIACCNYAASDTASDFREEHNGRLRMYVTGPYD